MTKFVIIFKGTLPITVQSFIDVFEGKYNVIPQKWLCYAADDRCRRVQVHCKSHMCFRPPWVCIFVPTQRWRTCQAVKITHPLPRPTHPDVCSHLLEKIETYWGSDIYTDNFGKVHYPRAFRILELQFWSPVPFNQCIWWLNPIRFLGRWPGVIQSNYSLQVLWDGVKKSGCSSLTADWVLVLVPTSAGMALVIPSPLKLQIWVDTSFSHYLLRRLRRRVLAWHRARRGLGLAEVPIRRAAPACCCQQRRGLGTPQRNKTVLSRSNPREDLKCESGETLPRPPHCGRSRINRTCACVHACLCTRSCLKAYLYWVQNADVLLQGQSSRRLTSPLRPNWSQSLN